MKRIYIFDFIRSSAIFGVVLLHALMHEWTGTSAVESGSSDPSVMVQILFYCITMAGLFYFVSGSVNAFTMYKRVESERNKPRQILIGGIIMGVFLLVMNYFFRFFFSADSGLIYFWIRDGVLQWPDNELIVRTNTLAMLGWTAIIVPSVLSILFKDKGYKNAKHNYIALAGIALTLIIITPFIRSALAPYVVNWIDEGKLLPAILLGVLVYDLFPIFPYAAYGLFGAMVGIALARDENQRHIKLLLGVSGAILGGISIIGLNAFGGIDPSIYRLNTTEAMFNKTFLQYSQLGLFCFLIMFGLIFFDFIPEEVQKKRTRFFTGLRRLGFISLTIFLFEAFITVILRRIVDLIPFLAGWDENLGTVAIFGFVNVILWIVIARYWERKEYVGSVEWCVLKLIEIFSGKKSDKFDMKRVKGTDDASDEILIGTEAATTVASDIPAEIVPVAKKELDDKIRRIKKDE